MEIQNLVPSHIIVADTADTSCYVALWESATGALPPKSDAGLTYNAGTGTLTATVFTDGTLSISSGSITSAVDGTFSGLVTANDILITEPTASDVKIGGLSVSALYFAGQAGGNSLFVDFFTTDGDATDSCVFQIFGKGTVADQTNSEYLIVGWSASATQNIIGSVAAGTGTVRELEIYTGLNADQILLKTDGSVEMSGALSVTGDITTSGDLYIDEDILHTGDTTTYIKFETGIIHFACTDSGELLTLTGNVADQVLVTSNTSLFQSDATGNVFTNYAIIDGVYILGATDRNIGIGDTTTLDALSTGDDNIAIGAGAGTDLTEGYQNVLMGSNAGGNLTTGLENVLIGRSSGFDATTARWNTIVGVYAGNNLTTTSADGNAVLGYAALYLATSAKYNVAVGWGAMWGTAGGSCDYNIAIGYDAGYKIDDGAYNVMIGYKAGYNITGTTSDAYNILIGYQAGDNITTGSNNIVIGYNLDASAAAATNDLNIAGIITSDDYTTYVRIGDGWTATNYARFASDGELTLAGTARVTQRITVDAGQMSFAGGGTEAALALVGSTVTRDFDAADGTEYEAYYNFLVPYDWDSSTGINVYILLVSRSRSCGKNS